MSATSVFTSMIKPIIDCSHGAPSEEEKLRLLGDLRAASPELAQELDRQMVKALHKKHAALLKTEAAHQQFEQILSTLKNPPWRPATVLSVTATPSGNRLMVFHDNRRSVVDLLGDVPIDQLRPGDEVFLDSAANAVVARSEIDMPYFGETASFERYLPTGGAMIRYRDEEKVVQMAGRINGLRFRRGDLVQWDEDTSMIFARVERDNGNHMFLEDTPSDTFADLGGIDAIVSQLTSCLAMQIRHPEVAREYGQRPVGSFLLEGPPGNGKTKLVRAVTNWLKTITGVGRAFLIHVKPGSQRSMWYGKTEENYRALFAVAKKTSEDHPGVPVVLFFDEIDSIGRVRGQGNVDDRVLPALFAEMDGLESRGNVWLIGATNRADVLDPGLLRPERLGGMILKVPRPNMEAARQIFGIYLRPDRPYARNGHGDNLDATRREIIDAAVSAIYSPNAQERLATIHFRDGAERPVTGADLVSGAVIANVVGQALSHAAQRQIAGGERGLRLDDVMGALAQQMRSAAGILTPANCRHHLQDMPDDAEVMAVRRTPPRVAHAYTYLDPA